MDDPYNTGVSCPECGGPTRWLQDEDHTWEPHEVPILICCECGEEVEV